MTTTFPLEHKRRQVALHLPAHDNGGHMAAQHTASASTEILSVEQAASRSAKAFGEIASLTARVSERANDLESKVAAFFNRVRAA